MCCRLSGFTLTPVDTRSSQRPIHLDLNLKPVKNKYLSTLSKHCQLASSQPQTYFSKAVYPHLFPNVPRLCQAFTKHCGTRKPALYAASDPGRWVALWLVSCSRWFDGFNVHRMDKAGGGGGEGSSLYKITLSTHSTACCFCSKCLELLSLTWRGFMDNVQFISLI